MESQIIHGDCLEKLKELPEGIADCCVTSPPYYGLRDYGVDGQIGLEDTPTDYIDKLVSVFREVRRTLKDDGTLWLNIGDSYAGGQGRWGGLNKLSGKQNTNVGSLGQIPKYSRWEHDVIKQKDLIGIPWTLAFALREDGWYLRQDIIWAKPNPMPESVRDRCTKSHEYIFLLSKSPKYYFDAEAISEPVAESTHERLLQYIDNQIGSYTPSKRNGNMKAVLPRFGGNKYGDSDDPKYRTKSGNEYNPYKNLEYNGQANHSMHLRRAEGMHDIQYARRNKRDVWIVSTQAVKEAHFATFPEKLIEPCILAGCKVGGVVLDPFFGSGTTGRVATKLNRSYIGIELNPKYIEIGEKRNSNIQMTLTGLI